MNDFKSTQNVDVPLGALYQTKNQMTFTTNDTGFDYVFQASTILNAELLFPNVLENISLDSITDINDLVNHFRAQIGNEFFLGIYDVMENALVFIDIANAANYTNVQGALS